MVQCENCGAVVIQSPHCSRCETPLTREDPYEEENGRVPPDSEAWTESTPVDNPSDRSHLERIANTDLNLILVLGFLLGPLAYVKLRKYKLAALNLVTLNYLLLGPAIVPIHCSRIVTNARDELRESEDSRFEPDRDDDSYPEVNITDGPEIGQSGVSRREAIVGSVGIISIAAYVGTASEEEDDQTEPAAVGEDQQGEDATDPQGESDEPTDDELSGVPAEWAALTEMSHGIEVLDVADSTDYSWTVYYRTTGGNDAAEYELGAFADAFAWLVDEHPDEAPDNLIVYAIGDTSADPLSDGAVGGFYVERGWAEEWLDGLMTDEEYSLLVAATYEEEPP